MNKFLGAGPGSGAWPTATVGAERPWPINKIAVWCGYIFTGALLLLYPDTYPLMAVLVVIMILLRANPFVVVAWFTLMSSVTCSSFIYSMMQAIDAGNQVRSDTLKVVFVKTLTEYLVLSAFAFMACRILGRHEASVRGIYNVMFLLLMGLLPSFLYWIVIVSSSQYLDGFFVMVFGLSY